MAEPKIVVTRRIPEPAVEMLREAGDVWVSPDDRPLEVSELHDAIAGADVVVTLLHDKVDDAFLDAAGDQLRAVCNVAVGFDNIDVPAATKRGVLVTNTPAVLTEATADLTIALILAVTRRLIEGDAEVRRTGECIWEPLHLLGTGLQGKRLGIIGLGRIGQAVAQRARAFGMDVIGVRRGEPLDELLATSDIVSIHAPLSRETRHLIDAHALAKMKPGAYLVNTSRGALVDEAALCDALDSGHLRGAALDVYEREPEVSARLLTMTNVVLAPHIGSATEEARTAMARIAATDVRRFLRGEPPLHVVV